MILKQIHKTKLALMDEITFRVSQNLQIDKVDGF